jgi:hypothetical protein
MWATREYLITSVIFHSERIRAEQRGTRETVEDAKPVTGRP